MLLFGSNDGLHCVDVETGAGCGPSSFRRPSRASSKPARLYRAVRVRRRQQPGAARRAASAFADRPHFYYMASSPKVIDAQQRGLAHAVRCSASARAAARSTTAWTSPTPTARSSCGASAGDRESPGRNLVRAGAGPLRPATTDYPNGVFGAVVRFRLQPEPASYPSPTTLGKSLYILNLTEVTNGAPSIIYSNGRYDYDRVRLVAHRPRLPGGELLFAPPVAFVSPKDRDPYVDEIYIGDYAGNLYQFVLDKANITNTNARPMFQAKNGDPSTRCRLSPPSTCPASAINQQAAASPSTRRTARAAGVDVLPGQGQPAGFGYHPRLGPGRQHRRVTTFNPATSKGFYFEFPGAAEGESSPFRPPYSTPGPGLGRHHHPYKFFVGSKDCVPSTTPSAPASSAYVFNALNGGYFNSPRWSFHPAGELVRPRLGVPQRRARGGLDRQHRRDVGLGMQPEPRQVREVRRRGRRMT